MGLVLTVGFYICFLFFIAGYLVRMLTWARQGQTGVLPGTRLRLSTFLNAAVDVLLLRRLLRVNDVLWLGEWIFHASLVVLFFRHLRYFLEPAPFIVVAMDIPARIASWLLLASVIYIAVMKLVIEKKAYVSSYNFLLLGLMTLACLSGLVLKYSLPADLADVKHFTLGLVTFHTVTLPESLTFMLHFIVFLVLFVSLPSHIVAAPLTMIEARQRDEELPYLMHER